MTIAILNDQVNAQEKKVLALIADEGVTERVTNEIESLAIMRNIMKFAGTADTNGCAV
jgi:RNA-binding protein YhbY